MGLLAKLCEYLRQRLQSGRQVHSEGGDREVIITGAETMPSFLEKPSADQVAVHYDEVAPRIPHPLLTTRLLERAAPGGAQELLRCLVASGLPEAEADDIVSEVLVTLVQLRLARGFVTDMGDIIKAYSRYQDADGRWVTQKLVTPARVRKPVTEADLHTAETRMQVRFPRLFRRLYTEVGNGGFGPGYGLATLDEIISGYQDDLSNYNGMVEEDESGEEYTNLLWPNGLIYLGTEGCTYYFYLDCRDPHYRVLMFSDSHYQDRLEEGMRQLAETFDDWIGHWAMPNWASERSAIERKVGDVSFPAN